MQLYFGKPMYCNSFSKLRYEFDYEQRGDTKLYDITTLTGKKTIDLPARKKPPMVLLLE